MTTWSEGGSGFGSVSGLLCTRNGRSLLVADQAQSILHVLNTQTTRSRQTLEMPRPRAIAYDRKTLRECVVVTASPIVYVSCSDGIRRIDTTTDQCKLTGKLDLKPAPNNRINTHALNMYGLTCDVMRHSLSLSPLLKRIVVCWCCVLFVTCYVCSRGIDTTLSGVLIVACDTTYSLYAIDPDSHAVSKLAGSGRAAAAGNRVSDAPAIGDANHFASLRSVVVMDDRHCAFVVDPETETIRCVSLPPFVFPSVE